MNRPLSINPYLALVTLACLGLAGATAYFLLVIPEDFTPNNPDWLVAGASWASPFKVSLLGSFVL